MLLDGSHKALEHGTSHIFWLCTSLKRYIFSVFVKKDGLFGELSAKFGTISSTRAQNDFRAQLVVIKKEHSCFSFLAIQVVYKLLKSRILLV